MKSLPTHSPSNVAALDGPNESGAAHLYAINGDPDTRVQFQKGPRKAEDSTPGIFDDDLLAIIQDRLEGFQAGPFACKDNGDALIAVRAARGALAKRVARRMAAGVLGKNENHPEGEEVSW
jgi:hypothetical protein